MTSPEPRWATARNLDRETRGDQIDRLAKAFGVEPYAWQRRVFDTALEIDPETGVYAYRTVGVNVGRQNGKTVLASLRIALELEQPGHRVALTAQDRNRAYETWLEHCDLIEEAGLPIDKQIRGAGREELRMTNGARYSVFTPGGKGVRGKTLDLVCIDEALTHQMDVIGAAEPTMATKPAAQMWLVSNAGDASSTMLGHYRNLGHELVENPDRPNEARLAWFEWAPADDRFDLHDADVWRQAIPTLAEDAGVSEEAVSQAAHTQPAELFAKEWLNVWASTSSTAVIDPDLWNDCGDPNLHPPPAGIVFGLDVAPERNRAAIVACGRARGRWVVEVVDTRDSVGWIHQRLIDLTRKHRGSEVVIDGGQAAAGAFIPQLEQDNVPVRSIGMKDVARAAGLFYDAVQSGDLAHANDPRLTDAVTVAARRSLGDAWAFSRRTTADLSPLIAASFAVYGSITANRPTAAIH